jgi:hypothetical protein
VLYFCGFSKVDQAEFSERAEAPPSPQNVQKLMDAMEDPYL